MLVSFPGGGAASELARVDDVTGDGLAAAVAGEAR